MKLYLSALALFLMLAFIADIRISFFPFSISFARPWLAVGIILIMGVVVVREVKEEIKEPVKIKESI